MEKTGEAIEFVMSRGYSRLAAEIIVEEWGAEQILTDKANLGPDDDDESHAKAGNPKNSPLADLLIANRG